MRNIELVEENDLVKFCSRYQEAGRQLFRATLRTYGTLGWACFSLLLPLVDRQAKKWLRKTANPYLAEIDQFAQILGTRGAHALNLSYEWGCTSAAFATQKAPDLLRVLDWPFKGLGAGLFVLRQVAEAGDFYNITWPGVSGIFQGMAPQRFAASLNQAPMRRHGLTYLGDWLKNRGGVARENGLPPAHLLRQVFETAPNYQVAKTQLMTTPICLPVIYLLSGTASGEACVIERLQREVAVRELSDAPQVSATNHFQSPLGGGELAWRPRYISKARARAIECLHHLPPSPRCLSYPLLNRLTKMSLVTNAEQGTLALQGWEKQASVTTVFRL